MGDISVSPLRAFSLGTLHTVSFVAAVVAGVHAGGSLRSRLASLDTASGVLLFLALWALTWFVTRRSLERMDPPIDAAGSGTIVMHMTVAGGWNGIGIFAALLVFGLWTTALHAAPAVAFLPLFFLIAVIGSALAFTIGAIVGMCYGLIDALLVGCGSALHQWARTVSRESV